MADPGADRAAAPLLSRLVLFTTLWALLQLGCAGHEARVETALAALDRGQPELAAAELNAEMEVASNDEVPAELSGDNALLLLDRATILLSMDEHQLSRRDFGLADKAIDLLDLSRDAADDVGKYLFSDDVGPYRAPAFEKLLLNTFNMMNYLALRDLSGARVEARRLEVMQRYLEDKGERTSLIGLGSYLAGFSYEKSGRHEPALKHYEEALAYKSYATLREPLAALTAGQPTSPRIDALVAGRTAEPVATAGDSELVVVVGYGRVPPKVPTRIPIGVALTLVAHHLSPHDHAMANELAAKGLVTWVNFPRLGKSRGKYAIPQLWVDGRPQPLEHALDIEAEVRRAWDEKEDTVILSAITRMLARAAAGELVHRGSAAAGKSNAAGIVGLLAGLATSATLTALDTPDTRSWVTLPSNVAVARLRVPPGTHSVRIAARGWTKDLRVTTRPRDWAFVTMNALR